jgi:hypothetical protein
MQSILQVCALPWEKRFIEEDVFASAVRTPTQQIQQRRIGMPVSMHPFKRVSQ